MIPLHLGVRVFCVLRPAGVCSRQLRVEVRRPTAGEAQEQEAAGAGPLRLRPRAHVERRPAARPRPSSPSAPAHGAARHAATPAASGTAIEAGPQRRILLYGEGT